MEFEFNWSNVLLNPKQYFSFFYQESLQSQRGPAILWSLRSSVWRCDHADSWNPPSDSDTLPLHRPCCINSFRQFSLTITMRMKAKGKFFTFELFIKYICNSLSSGCIGLTSTLKFKFRKPGCKSSIQFQKTWTCDWVLIVFGQTIHQGEKGTAYWQWCKLIITLLDILPLETDDVGLYTHLTNLHILHIDGNPASSGHCLPWPVISSVTCIPWCTVSVYPHLM